MAGFYGIDESQIYVGQQVGSNQYLQMDLDVLCWGELHWYWFFNLFLPGFFLYVVGLPMITVAILKSKRHHLYGRWTKFRY